jgi:RNA polymerase sigma factor (sigma-70 family)
MPSMDPVEFEKAISDKKLYRDLLRYAVIKWPYYYKSGVAAEDVVQSALLTLWTLRNTFDPEKSSFKTTCITCIHWTIKRLYYDRHLQKRSGLTFDFTLEHTDYRMKTDARAEDIVFCKEVLALNNASKIKGQSPRVADMSKKAINMVAAGCSKAEMARELGITREWARVIVNKRREYLKGKVA